MRIQIRLSGNPLPLAIAHISSLPTCHQLLPDWPDDKKWVSRQNLQITCCTSLTQSSSLFNTWVKCKLLRAYFACSVLWGGQCWLLYLYIWLGWLACHPTIIPPHLFISLSLSPPSSFLHTSSYLSLFSVWSSLPHLFCAVHNQIQPNLILFNVIQHNPIRRSFSNSHALTDWLIRTLAEMLPNSCYPIYSIGIQW